MKSIFFTLIFFQIIFAKAFSQESLTIYGFVSDSLTGERIAYATVFIDGTSIGIAANSHSFYSITTTLRNSLRLKFTHIGYQQKTIVINDTSKNIRLDIRLVPKSLLYEEVVVEGSRFSQLVKTNSMGVVSMQMSELQHIPSLGGEVDVLKALQTSAGVMTGQEFTNGFYVRGGDYSQNLILLDGVPIYNVSHLFGYFSIFNNDALQSIELIKGGMPARYGGRLSSILNVSMKEGNT